MYKIKRIKFYKHQVLGDLELDFCDLSGKPVDTIILAGENGTGKSTVINTLYGAVTFTGRNEMDVTVDIDGIEKVLLFRWHEINGYIFLNVNDNDGLNVSQDSNQRKEKYSFRAIYSDVDINFQGGNIQNVTSSELDKYTESHKSAPDLPTKIKQLIVDIQSMDDSDTAESYRNAVENKCTDIKAIVAGNRMQRFTKAFNTMFDELTYSKVINQNNMKAIMFTKYGHEINIDNLSSGEKQIVYRGCFLLRDINALSGAFVFIDEPEISLHPEWQKKILDYYKGIFTDIDGIQKSQMFVVTHSPFIIHNEKRKNDKVIVLKHDETGKVVALDRPGYYKCDSIDPIQDAFNIDDFTADTSTPIVYLEGRTDEKYFNKAVEVFGYQNLNFKFQWIGHLDSNGKEVFTGASSLNQGIKFIKGRQPQTPQVFLFDCDTKKQESDTDNVIVMTMEYFATHKVMNKGIENVLELDGLVKVDDFYDEHTQTGDYGNTVKTREFAKMKMCNYICSLDCEKQKEILKNLKPVIDRIIRRVDMTEAKEDNHATSAM